LHVLSSFQRTEPCIALPCFRSATFQIYDSSYIAVNPKNRPVARFFTPLSSPKPVKRRRIRHRGSSRLQDRSGSGRPGTCCAGPEATSTCHVDRRDSLRTSKNITRSRPCQILHRFEARQRPRTSKTPANPDFRQPPGGPPGPPGWRTSPLPESTACSPASGISGTRRADTTAAATDATAGASRGTPQASAPLVCPPCGVL